MDANARMDRFERRLDAISKIVQTGMKMLVKMQEENREFKKETRHAINALIAAQERAEERMDRAEQRMNRADARQDRLDARLERFIESQRNGHNGNGHKKN